MEFLEEVNYLQLQGNEFRFIKSELITSVSLTKLNFYSRNNERKYLSKFQTRKKNICLPAYSSTFIISEHVKSVQRDPKDLSIFKYDHGI